MNRMNFKETMLRVRNCNSPDECLIRKYFSIIFKEMCTETGNKEKSINKITFAIYLGLPQFLSNKIFKELTKKSDNLMTETSFIYGMLRLYFGELEDVTEIIFNIFKKNENDQIDISNFLFAYKHLASDANDFNKFESSLRKYEANTLTLENFNNYIFYRDIKSIVIFLTKIYEKKPFNLDIFSLIQIVSQDLDEDYTYLNTDENSAYSKPYENVSFKNYFKINEGVPVYKLIDGTIVKYIFVISDLNLALFKYVAKNKYFLSSIKPLSVYFFKCHSKMYFDDKVLYSVCIYPKMYYSNSDNFNTFYFKSKDELSLFLQRVPLQTDSSFFFTEHTFLDQIQENESAEIIKVRNKKTKKELSVKMLKKSKSNSTTQHIMNEVEILTLLKRNPNKNVIKIYDIFEDSSRVYIVMEYLKYNLEAFTKKYFLSYNEKLDIMHQINSGISYLHSLRILHRDIKFQNVMVKRKEGKFVIKIIDFGLSKILLQNETTSEVYGTLIYLAPEVIKKSNYDLKIDIWSYGVLLYYLFYLEMPFDGDEIEAIFYKICYDYSHLKKLKKSKNRIDNIILNCLNKNPDERLCINNIELLL